MYIFQNIKMHCIFGARGRQSKIMWMLACLSRRGLQLQQMGNASARVIFSNSNAQHKLAQLWKQLLNCGKFPWRKRHVWNTPFETGVTLADKRSPPHQKKKTFYLGDFSQMWVDGMADSQTRSKPLKKNHPKNRLFRPEFHLSFSQISQKPWGWVGKRIWEWSSFLGGGVSLWLN